MRLGCGPFVGNCGFGFGLFTLDCVQPLCLHMSSIVFGLQLFHDGVVIETAATRYAKVLASAGSIVRSFARSCEQREGCGGDYSAFHSWFGPVGAWWCCGMSGSVAPRRWD